MSDTVPLPPNDPVREHYAAIGVVAAEWANFEAIIDYCTIRLTGLRDDFGACLTSQISGSARKLDAYISVARNRGATDVDKDLKKFSEAVARLAERRNRIVHDPWSVSHGQTPRRFEITARKILKYEFVEVSTADVHNCAADIRLVVDQLEKLHERIIFQVGASPDTTTR